MQNTVSGTLVSGNDSRLQVSMGNETANGRWDNPYAIQFTFSIAGRQFFYGQNLKTHYWFIQELLPGGKMGQETANGRWDNSYAVQFAFSVGGRQYFYGQNLETNYWFIQELLAGGKMGQETANGRWNTPYASQFAFSVGGRQFFYGQNLKTNYWFIQELLAGGKMGQETANGTLDGPFAVQFPFSVGGSQYFYGQNINNRSWFIKELLAGGKVGKTTASGRWDNAYAVQFAYPAQQYGRQYFYGQNLDTNYWFVQELLPGGAMGEEIMNGRWGNPYATQFAYEQGGISYFYGQNQSSNYWFIQELLSDTEYTVRRLPLLDYSNSASAAQEGAPGVCLDAGSSTSYQPSYAVGWSPYLADWIRYVKNGGPIFKYHDPAEIDGVGILLPMRNGKLYGDQLKRQITEELPLYEKSEGHYSWVLTPGGKILYKWNSQLELDSRQYTRHSDLNQGRPVTCAGEFYLTRRSSNIFLTELYIEINDSSGHYKPSAAVCFRYVLEEFEALGIDLNNIEGVYTRN